MLLGSSGGGGGGRGSERSRVGCLVCGEAGLKLLLGDLAIAISVEGDTFSLSTGNKVDSGLILNGQARDIDLQLLSS